jgi:endonuclease/exonuclease/phosphatase (EEP) superfamily protein YafD
LRVVTFNVLGNNTQYTDVVDWLAEVDADVVFLHEASRPWEEAMINSDLGYRVEATRDDDGIFGTLVLVRPGAEIQSFGFNQGEPRSVEVRLTTFEDREVSLLGIHPLAPTTEDRAGLRDAQVRYAAQWAARQTGPTIVTGDFNAGPWSHAFYRLLDDGGLRNSQRGFGLDATFPANSNLAFRIAIDHLLHSGDVWVAERSLGPPLGSDHFPLIVDLLIG